MVRRKSASTKATPASAKSHKRRLSENAAVNTPGSRASKRLKDSEQKPGNIKATPTKSKYFEDPDSDDVEEGRETEDDAAESGYENEDASAADDSIADGSDEEEDDDDSEEEVKARKSNKKKRPSGGGGKSTLATVIDKGKELWRQGVSTGLGPGKQVFIEKPKPRGDGGIKYQPEKIHPNTMEFLKDLKKNNDREWLKCRCHIGGYLIATMMLDKADSSSTSST